MRAMNIIGDFNQYLRNTEWIDFKDEVISTQAIELKNESKNRLELIQRTYEYVRDKIGHSADIDGEVVTCKASDVLKVKEGICYAKSHLLAALLRANGIPCGFCYQKLRLNDEINSSLILHGLNAVYIDEVIGWIRLDSRGNKPGVNAQFDLTEEKLAFNVRTELGEEDIMNVYSKPDSNVVNSLLKYLSVNELFNNLPQELSNCDNSET